MLQRVQSGVVRRADDLGVAPVGRGPEPWSDIITTQTLRVADGVILPGIKGHAVQRALQDPVTWQTEQRVRRTLSQTHRRRVRRADGSHQVEES